MNLLINKGKSVDQKCNAQYFLRDDQWFNLTAHDMRRTLVDSGMKYHRPQIIHGTSLPKSTSPPSPVPMTSSIQLEPTPCDSTSTTTSMNKTCLLNTSCDHKLHLDHPNTSIELQDLSIVGRAESESILDSEDLLQLDFISVSSQATCSIETEFIPEFKGQMDDTNLSPTDVFSGHHDYEMFLLQKEIDAPHANLNHHACEEQDQDVILTHAIILSHTFALPQFMDQHSYEYQDPTNTPSTVPTSFQVSCDHSLHPECAHNPMETQCNQSQYPILMKQNCTHNPSTSQFRKSYHSNPETFPYPTDPGGHALEMSTAPTTLVERGKLDLSSLVPPNGVMERSFSWTCSFKSPTSSTLCFGEATLGKLNQETDFYMTKHMPKSPSEANRVSVSHSS